MLMDVAKHVQKDVKLMPVRGALSAVFCPDTFSRSELRRFIMRAQSLKRVHETDFMQRLVCLVLVTGALHAVFYAGLPLLL